MALFVCLACAGAASAFSVTQAAITEPDTSLVPGEVVTSNVKILIPKGTIDESGSLKLGTDLIGQSWTVNVSKGKGGLVVTTLHPTSYNQYVVTGFDLSGYSTDVELDIYVMGKVATESAGHSISAIRLTESGTTGSGLKSYNSPEQRVYDTGLLKTKLDTLINEVTNIENALTYLDGSDVSAIKAKIDTVRAKYQAAVAAGTEQGVAAFGYYEAGDAALKEAKQLVAYSLLSIILSHTTQIDNNITLLYAKGWNTEGHTIFTANEDLKTRYASCLNVYQAGDPNIADLVTLRNDAVDLDEMAGKYVEESQNPFGNVGDTIGKIWPFIAIGAAVIVVGIIVFIIIRKRKNSWDELG